MGTVVHAYDPDQSVYIIAECDGKAYIASGTVVRVRIASLITGTDIQYDIRLDDLVSGTQVFLEKDIFVDKPAALAEYETRI